MYQVSLLCHIFGAMSSRLPGQTQETDAKLIFDSVKYVFEKPLTNDLIKVSLNILMSQYLHKSFYWILSGIRPG
jgi:hypothetical protein